MADKEKKETGGWLSDLFGMDRHVEKPNDQGGTHNTVSNDVTRISWDTDKNGNLVEKDSQGRPTHHETPAPNTTVGNGGTKKK